MLLTYVYICLKPNIDSMLSSRFNRTVLTHEKSKAFHFVILKKKLDTFINTYGAIPVRERTVLITMFYIYYVITV